MDVEGKKILEIVLNHQSNTAQFQSSDVCSKSERIFAEGVNQNQSLRQGLNIMRNKKCRRVYLLSNNA
jgi:hypothetical protein